MYAFYIYKCVIYFIYNMYIMYFIFYILMCIYIEPTQNFKLLQKPLKANMATFIDNLMFLIFEGICCFASRFQL